MKIQRLAIVLAGTLLLSGCQTVTNMFGGDISKALTSISGLSGNVSKWASGLSGGNLTDMALEKLGGFSEQAGNIGETLKNALSDAKPETVDKIEPVQKELSKLSDVNVGSLKMAGEETRRDAVNSFSKTASGLGDMVKKLLGN